MEQLHGTPLRTTARNTGQRRRSNTDFLGIAILIVFDLLFVSYL